MPWRGIPAAPGATTTVQEPAKRSQPAEVKPKRKPPARTWKTIAEETGGAVEYTSFASAKNALGTRPDQQIHHICEQCQGLPHRSGFSQKRINSTDNLVWLPKAVHQRVSNRYSRTARGTDKTVRDGLNGLPWDEQFDRGVEIVNWAIKEQERHDSERG